MKFNRNPCAHTENQAVYRRDAGHIAPRLVLRMVRSYRSFTRRARTFAARRVHQISFYLFLIRRAKRVTRAKRGHINTYSHWRGPVLTLLTAVYVRAALCAVCVGGHGIDRTTTTTAAAIAHAATFLRSDINIVAARRARTRSAELRARRRPHP